MVLGQRFLSLDSETANCLNLGRSGVILLRSYKWQGDLAGMLSCFALASEKLLKLTLGLAQTADSQPWPSVETMRGWGHDVVSLDARAREQLQLRLQKATHPAYIRGLIAKVEANPISGMLISLMSDYGSNGRFHDLNALADQPRQKSSPAEQWSEIVDRIVLPKHAHLLGDVTSPWLVHVRAEAETAILDWWFMYSRAWMHGVFGEEAKRHSSSVDVARLREGL